MKNKEFYCNIKISILKENYSLSIGRPILAAADPVAAAKAIRAEMG